MLRVRCFFTGFLWVGLIVVGTCTILAHPEDARADAKGDEMGRTIERVAGPKDRAARVGRGRASQTRAKDKIHGPVSETLATIEARGLSRENWRAADAAKLSSRFVRISPSGEVQVYLFLTAMSQDVLTALTQREARVELGNSQHGVIQAWVPFDRMADIAALDEVLSVTAPRYASTRKGSRQTQGDAIVRANKLRATGLDGSGVRVGVISDGANNRSSAVKSGDLPSDITVFGSCRKRNASPASCRGAWGCNEGTAILEIIHDIAPGADLAIGTASTSLEFVRRVDQLANDFKADIIVDDLGFFGEPFFEDGMVAKAVAAVSNKVVFASAAGNDALGHYEKLYRSRAVGGVSLHDFGAAANGSSNTSMRVTIPAGDYLPIVLQWNDPAGESSNDYDLYLFDDDMNDLLCPGCASTLFQDGSQDPIEALCYYNATASNVRGRVVVTRFSGQTRFFEMFVLGTRRPQFNVSSGSVFGHSAVTGVLAVGAIDASDPGANTIEPFSSRGHSRIDFPTRQTRLKPNITGVDGVSVTGAGGFPTRFFGTSAAAPHVAGVAALLLQKTPIARSVQVREALIAGAVDLGASGHDSIYGAGRLDALGAADELQVSNPMSWLGLLLED